MMGEGAWGWGSTSHIYSQNSKQMQFRNSRARITTCGVGIRFAHTHLLLLYSDDWNEGDSPNEMRNNIFLKELYELLGKLLVIPFRALRALHSNPRNSTQVFRYAQYLRILLYSDDWKSRSRIRSIRVRDWNEE